MSDAVGQPAPARRRKSETQRAKEEATRQRLLDAMADVVAEHGFEKTTVAAITAKADTGHGAFYLHFPSRHDAFYTLLDQLGISLMDATSEAVRDSIGVVEIERRGLEANLAFSTGHPAMHRLMAEAELFAQSSYHKFMAGLRRRYVASLRRSQKAGELVNFAESELETVAVLLMGMRRALIHAYCLEGWYPRQPPARVLQTYLKLAGGGLAGLSAQTHPTPEGSSVNKKIRRKKE